MVLRHLNTEGYLSFWLVKHHVKYYYLPQCCILNIPFSHLLLNFSGCFSRIRWKRWAMEASCKREEKRQHYLQHISKPFTFSLLAIGETLRQSCANGKAKLNHPSLFIKITKSLMHIVTELEENYCVCLKHNSHFLHLHGCNGLCDIHFVICSCPRESWLVHTVQLLTISTTLLF